MEITSIQKQLTNTPRKLRLVADMVRSMQPDKALNTLQFVSNAAAVPLSKAIKTALANAKQVGANLDQIYFKHLEINEGVDLKRRRPAARGRVRPYKKRTSQIRIVLSDEKKEVLK